MSRTVARKIVIGTTAVAVALGAGIALVAPASAVTLRDRHAEQPQWPSGLDDMWTCMQGALPMPGRGNHYGWERGNHYGWGADDWNVDWDAINDCLDPNAAARADLDAALATAQSTYDDALAAAQAIFSKTTSDELAAYREGRAATRSQAERLLLWRGFVSSTRDEQRILDKAKDAAARDLALDQDAAYEIFDLETTDEVTAAGRSDFRAARTAAQKSQTLALRGIDATYNEAVDVAVQRLAQSMSEVGNATQRSAAWKQYRKAMVAARTAKGSATQEAQAMFDSAMQEAASLLVPGDDAYANGDCGVMPIPMPFPMPPMHRGHDNDD